MKKIINGRKYDTETAKEIACWNNGYLCSDFNYCKETLYLKKTGEYFLYGEGGALTQYSRSVFGGSIGGSRIIPLTEESAKEWAMEHLECEFQYISCYSLSESRIFLTFLQESFQYISCYSLSY